MLFSSASPCRHVPVNDSLVVGDPDHHECSFFKVSGLETSPSDSKSENKPLKNFAKENFDVISAELDLDWDNLLECDINERVNCFYSVLNVTIERTRVKIFEINIRSQKDQSQKWPNLNTFEMTKR